MTKKNEPKFCQICGSKDVKIYIKSRRSGLSYAYCEQCLKQISAARKEKK